MSLQSVSDASVNALNTATELTNEYLVAPIQNLGIAGFRFTTRGEIKSEIQAQVSDNFNEKGISLTDTSIMLPELFTLSGFIGEISYKTLKEKNKGLKSLAQRLTTIAGYLPILTASAKQLQSAISSNKTNMQGYLDAALGSGINLYQTFKQLNPPPTEQAKAYNFFLAMIRSRQPVSFESPYGFKANYYLTNVTMIQPEFTEGKSDIQITLKQLNFATTQLVPFDPNKYQGRGAQQNSPIDNKGATSTNALSSSSQSLANKFKLISPL